MAQGQMPFGHRPFFRDRGKQQNLFLRFGRVPCANHVSESAEVSPCVRVAGALARTLIGTQVAFVGPCRARTLATEVGSAGGPTRHVRVGMHNSGTSHRSFANFSLLQRLRLRFILVQLPSLPRTQVGSCLGPGPCTPTDISKSLFVLGLSWMVSWAPGLQISRGSSSAIYKHRCASGMTSTPLAMGIQSGRIFGNACMPTVRLGHVLRAPGQEYLRTYTAWINAEPFITNTEIAPPAPALVTRTPG